MMRNLTKRKESILLAAAVLLLAGGFLSGYVAENALERRPKPSSRTNADIRLQGFDLINPLLECEGADETIGDRLLPPFKQELSRIVQGLIDQGAAHRIAVYFRDLNNGPWTGIHENDKFYPASLLKLPVAMAVMKQAETDRQILKSRVASFGKTDLNAGVIYPPRNPLRKGRSYTVAELIDRSLSSSDNNAVQLLNGIANRRILAETFHDLGVRYPIGAPVDYLSPKTFSTFFRILYNASYLSKESSERLLEIMGRSEFEEGLTAGVPRRVTVAHKHGEQTLGLQGEEKELHDCGIVYYPNSPYLLCVMSKGDGFSGNASAIREVSRFVFNVVDRHQRSLQNAKESRPAEISGRNASR